MMQRLSNRENIIEKISPFIGKGVIKVLTGQRRVGKSYALKQIGQALKNQKIISINKELYEFDFIKNYHDLIEYVENQSKNKEAVLSIDEIQDIEEFEKALRHFQAKEIYDIYCTGSNAKLLSGELATFLSGRYVQFEINSLSFSEFKTFHNNDDLQSYIKFGGMPYLANLELSEEVAYVYLKNLYESIVLKDVVERFSLRNVKFLENLVYFLATNIGSLTTSKNIADYLKSQKINMTVNSVISYLEALKNCYFIHEVKRYDIIGKKTFEINHKYYFEDIGIRNSIVGYNEVRDLGKLLENMVYMHLRRQGYKIFVGLINGKEIDFVAEKNNEKKYFQVALRIESEKTTKREFENLLEVKDNYPKYVITLNSDSLNSYEGIKHLSLESFFEEI
jgi:predicted AAA+ superfamily ATPase